MKYSEDLNIKTGKIVLPNLYDKIEIAWDFKKGNILTISDQHFPFCHPDIYEFLEYVSNKYNCKLAINMGDWAENHNKSFHDRDLGLVNAQEEEELTAMNMNLLLAMFPNQLSVAGNHDIRQFRQAKKYALSMNSMSTLHDTYCLPTEFLVANRIIVRHTDTHGILHKSCFTHGDTKTKFNNQFKRENYNFIYGHFHTEFGITYFRNEDSIKFRLATGCLVDRHHPIFEYNERNLDEFIIGTGVIIDGVPKTIPMLLDKEGRWIGRQ